MEATVPVLVLSGTVGAGKSTVLDEVHDLLSAAGVPHACVDCDALSLSWPARGRFNQDALLENLASVWLNFRTAGAERLAIAWVVEAPGDLLGIQQAVPGARITLCQLAAGETTRLARLRARELGAGLEWHLRRTVELQRILDAEPLAAFTVVNDGRTINAVALEVLERAGWAPTAGSQTASRTSSMRQ